MNKRLLASIIVPIYNVEKYLDECVQSIVSQTYRNIEILLIDDGTKDKSGEIADCWAERDERIRVIHQKNQGISAARNIGLREVKGEYIFFVDSDDYIAENYVEELVSAMEKENTDISIPSTLEIVNCAQNSILSNLFKRMDYYRSIFNETAFYNLLPSLLNELLYNLSLSVDHAENNPFKTSTFLTEALEYINDNLFTIKTIKEVSEHFFVSEQYFFKQFQTQLKITPKKYINDKRLLHAQQMIQQGKKPIEVFEQCGFESYAGFYKQYVKTFGRSPSKEKQTQTI